MKYYDAISKLNPVSCFIYYSCAVILSVIIRHPVFTLFSLVSVLIYFFLIKKGNEFKFLSGLFVIVIIIAIINPLFNTYGNTELFRWANGRIYSLEALIYGAMIGIMLANILMIFSLYNNVMTNDKFIYIFGNISPRLALITSMSLRLVPEFKNRIRHISSARAAAGCGAYDGSFSSKIKSGYDSLLAMTNWAFEDGIITADSMRARGYGNGKRTSYKRYIFNKKDIFLTVLISAFFIFICICAALGGMYVDYYPSINMSGYENILSVASFIIYAIFLWIPVVINIKEGIKWHYMRSKI